MALVAIPARRAPRALAALVSVAALAAAASSAAAQEPSAQYNWKPMKPHDPATGQVMNGVPDYECIPPAAGSTATVRSWFFNDTMSPYSWRQLSWSGSTCPLNQLRIARWERRLVGGVTTYVMRGGGGTNAWEPAGTPGIRFGHVRASDITKQTSVITQYIPAKVGKAPIACTGGVYVNRPERGTTSDLTNLFYKPWQGSSSGAKWDNYGNQAGATPVPYNYLLWTTPTPEDNTGGGQIRGVMPTGDNIRLCDVAAVDLPMYPQNSGSSAGTVRMHYGRIRNANELIYGWFFLAWKRTAEATWHYMVDGPGVPPVNSDCAARDGASTFVAMPVGNCVQISVTDNRVGVRNAQGDCFANEGPLASSFVRVWAVTCTQIAMDGGRTGVRTYSDGCMVKEGSLSAIWVQEWPASCTQLSLSGSRIGVRISNGDCLVKEGPLNANWHAEWAVTCDEIAVGGAKIGVRTYSDGCLVKEGPLNAIWVHQRGTDCRQIAVSNNRIGVLTANGDCLAKDGLHGTFVVVWSVTCTQIDVTDTRVAVRTSSDGCLTKDGGLSSIWARQAMPCGQISIRGPRIGVWTPPAGGGGDGGGD
jgi:hypothetical protein